MFKELYGTTYIKILVIKISGHKIYINHYVHHYVFLNNLNPIEMTTEKNKCI